MIKKIIYINETFYRKHRDLGIEVFRKKGYEVELWSNLNLKYKNKLSIPEDSVEEKVIYFKNYGQLIGKIFKQNWTHTIAFFTTTTHRGGIEDFIRILIGVAGGRYCNFIYEIMPIGIIEQKKEQNLHEKIQSKTYDYRRRFYQCIINKFFGPVFCFVPTYQSTNKLLTAKERKVVIEVHNKDYDEYLLNRGEERKEKYILFIDEDLTNAEDFRKSNTSVVYPEKSIYFDNMNLLFSRLEEYYGIPVYIAAHPKCEYKGHEFNGRKIFFYQTCELVKNADLVLTHASAAVNFIILYRKPYIFLVDKYIKNHMLWKYVTLPSIRELRVKPCYFEREEEPWKYVNQPNEYYDLYFKKYIKNANFDGMLFYEIVERTIRKNERKTRCK
mgnify:CR=1 FL=1